MPVDVMRAGGGLKREDVAAAAQLACLLEASAPKPGNVAPGRHFADTRYEHFLASAAAVGAPLAGAGERPLGATIRLAVEATSRWTSSNTNLGIVLLLAPLARAALRPPVEGAPAESPGVASQPTSASQSWTHGASPSLVSDPVQGRGRARGTLLNQDQVRVLRATLEEVLDSATVEDAMDVYAAIRLARPGGLGKADAQDVSSEPTLRLVDVMRLAAERDSIAQEYATAFQITFTYGLPALEQARQDGLSWDDAVVETFLTLLALVPDTHVQRRGGAALAEAVSRRAVGVLSAGGVRSDEGRNAIAALDSALRDPRNTANPGTTADLTAAAIFAFLLAGGWAAAADS